MFSLQSDAPIESTLRARLHQHSIVFNKKRIPFFLWNNDQNINYWMILFLVCYTDQFFGIMKKYQATGRDDLLKKPIKLLDEMNYLKNVFVLPGAPMLMDWKKWKDQDVNTQPHAILLLYRACWLIQQESTPSVRNYLSWKWMHLDVF